MQRILIRKSCFETNSSSSHSVTLSGEDKEFILDTIYPNSQGVVEIKTTDFGWEWFKHNDAATKAAYAYQQYKHDLEKTALIIEVIKEQTAAKNVIFSTNSDSSESYIDHASTVFEGNFLKFDTKEEIRNFIFNKNSWLFGGNDNETPVPGFYDVSVYSISGQTKIKPTHYIEFEKLKGVRPILFNQCPTDEQVTDALTWATRNNYSYLENNRFVDAEYFSDEKIHKLPRVSKFKYHGNEYDAETQYGKLIFSIWREKLTWLDLEKTENQKSFDFKVKKIEENYEVLKRKCRNYNKKRRHEVYSI